MVASDLKWNSRRMTHETDFFPVPRAMLRGAGHSAEDLEKAQVGVLGNWYEGNSCNVHILNLENRIRDSINATGELLAMRTAAPGVSDGKTMGMEEMKYSFMSRWLLANLIQMWAGSERYDALGIIPGCDKQIPSAAMGLIRLNYPGLIVYGGTTVPGIVRGQDEDILSAFRAPMQVIAGVISPDHRNEIIDGCIPCGGACGAQYTANTMSMALEAMGLTLPNSAVCPAISDAKNYECSQVGPAILNLLKKNIRPRDIVTEAALNNSIAAVQATGGSTNAVLHLIAIANEAGINLDIYRFNEIGRKTRILTDLKPYGKYHAKDLFDAGGAPAFFRYLLDHGALDGKIMTVTGKTLEENVYERPGLTEGQKVVLPWDNPFAMQGNVRILGGEQQQTLEGRINLAPDTAVAKITGKEGTKFCGNAKVYDNESSATEGIYRGNVKPGDIVVIRYEGLKGGPGMREMLGPTTAISANPNLNGKVALITDARFSGGTDGFCICHISPEAYEGGPIAIVKNGDTITIDAARNAIELHITEREYNARMSGWRRPKPNYTNGIHADFANLVQSARFGGITSFNYTRPA